MDARLPARLEVAAFIRRTQTAGGFAAVLRKGDSEAGAILLVLRENGANPRLFERMPRLDGSRPWRCAKTQEPGAAQEFDDYLSRRGIQDGDLWIVELDIANPERLIGDIADEG